VALYERRPSPGRSGYSGRSTRPMARLDVTLGSQRAVSLRPTHQTFASGAAGIVWSGRSISEARPAGI